MSQLDGLFRLELVAVFIILLLVLLLNLIDLHIRGGAEERLEVLTFLDLVENELKLVGLYEVVGQHQFLGERHQLFDGRGREHRVNGQSAWMWMYLKAFSSIPGMILPRRGLDSSRHGLVLASISHTLKFSSIM
jgi:hypothetical protein